MLVRRRRQSGADATMPASGVGGLRRGLAVGIRWGRPGAVAGARVGRKPVGAMPAAVVAVVVELHEFLQ